MASLWIHQREPREWNLLDVSLIEETVERTWVAIERARTEEALRESEARYRSLLQNLPDYAIYRMDSAGIITEWNEGAQRMKGYSAQEMIGKHASICYTPEAVAAGQPAKDLREAAQTGRVERESIRIRKSGERFWVNEIATAIHDTHGQLTGFTKISRDITRRKRGQALQLQLEQRTRLAVEAAEMATWEWHLVTDKVYWNEQHFKLLGMTIETSPQPSEAFTRHLHPQDRTWVLAELQRAIDEQSLFDVEFRIIREDGVVRWMSGYGRVTGEEEGQPTQMSGAMLDITDRKQAEEEIRKSEERLQRVLSISTVGVIYFDLEGGIHKVNEAFQRMSGYPVEAFALGQVRWDTLTAPEFTQYTQIAVQEYRRKGENTPYEKQYIRPDGSRWWGLFAGKQLSEGEFVEFVLDITETKRAGEILKQADRKKDDFLAMLAHELRNPMATLRNGLQILSMTGTSPSQTRGVISMMSRQTEHLVRMVDDLLDVSRISRGKIELHQETVNLVELVRQSVESVTLLYEQKQQQLHVSLPKHPIEIEGDATRLVQVVTNLLTNAARYTGETGVVNLQLKHQGQEAILRIRDNGIGLASDQLTAIFELFVQVDNSLARSQGGLGLGLTLVKQIVELHGGQVEAQSKGLKQGSTFTVHLPTLTTSLASEASQTDTLPASEPLQILVVDDNLDATLTLSMLLELKGYQVHTRNSGRLALEAAEQLRPDVILLDIGMPDLDGYETCRHIRQQPWSQKMFIVAVSGYGLIEDKQKAKEVGFNEHLTKPLDLDALIHLLNTYQS
ncbi:hypothetical protein BWI93_07310 [Siphonobacter sp. BAB-5385]|uniref:hybrid sensor histidine kinase/response regulator n=1 Tax=Siphonobacter sp. BAB-5385 TaxID=1864822 RepID=UPI000B9EAB0F|nr:PAS domain S-box protein [Siphonobacter sp. BAB-5385]OZI08834.1 hypothetical protein BWI93_07310 [Siphonobacter sp. BAB-5385]